MIYGTLRTWSKDKTCYPVAFATALAFLGDMALPDPPPGRHEIDGDRIFVQISDSTTEPARKRRFELHREYIDIHLALSGIEQQLYAHEPESREGLVEDALATRDIAFYAHPARYNSILLEPGDYAIYLPGELHCPCCSPDAGGTVRKAIFKIHRSLLGGSAPRTF